MTALPDTGTFLARGAMRYYIFRTSNFEFRGDGTTGCDNAKQLTFNSDTLVDNSDGNIHTYNYQTWAPNFIDCCAAAGGGPHPNDLNLVKQDWRGKWWRIEIAMTNRDGPGYNLQMFVKNITDEGDEFEVIDLSLDDPGAVQPWVAAPTTLQPTERMNKMEVNLFRDAGATGTCKGWQAISHYMVAGWDTDAGQRIGAATEVESGGTPAPTPLHGFVRIPWSRR